MRALAHGSPNFRSQHTSKPETDTYKVPLGSYGLVALLILRYISLAATAASMGVQELKVTCFFPKRTALLVCGQACLTCVGVRTNQKDSTGGFAVLCLHSDSSVTVSTLTNLVSREKKTGLLVWSALPWRGVTATSGVHRNNKLRGHSCCSCNCFHPNLVFGLLGDHFPCYSFSNTFHCAGCVTVTSFISSIKKQLTTTTSNFIWFVSPAASLVVLLHPAVEKELNPVTQN